MSKKESSKVGIRPLGDRVLVKPSTNENETSPSGIIIPDTAGQEKTDRGEVIAVGEGKVGDDNKRVPVAVSVGDKVLFQWGEKIEYAGQDYYLVSEGNILAVID